MYYSYDRRAAAGRPTYSDGRLIPQAGDKVYQLVRGPFGTPASIFGEVAKSGKTVKVTGGGSMIGAIPKGKSYKMSPEWTVVDDPSIKAREEERKRLQSEEKAQAEQAQLVANETLERKAHGMGLRKVRSISELKPGDEAVALVSDFRHGHGDPKVVHEHKVTVHAVHSGHFTYMDDFTKSESTSGDPSMWWTRK